MKQLAILAPLALFACAPANGPEAVATDANSLKTPYGFEVQLTLTPRTVEKLEEMSEMVTVSGMFWGEPKDDARPRADEMGQINLGADDIVVQPASRLVLVPGAAIDLKILASDVEGPPLVQVHVYTAGRAHADNLITCGIYEGPVAMAQDKPVEIECDLIEPPAPEPLPASEARTLK